MNKIRMRTLLLLGAMGFTSCTIDDDEPQDKIDTINATISAILFLFFSSIQNSLLEGLAFKVDGESDYEFLPIWAIKWLIIIDGYGHTIQLQRTTLANPPADAPIHEYKFLKIYTSEDKAVLRKFFTMYVSSEIGEYNFYDENHNSVWSCPAMKYKDSEDDDWSVGPFNRIKDFTYEPGYDYELSVQKTIFPEIDCSSLDFQTTQYKLLGINKRELAKWFRTLVSDLAF